jgi:folate-binding Fe-S cluster repair protein YgfZ
VAKVFNLGQPPRRLTLLHLDGSAIDLPTTGEKVLAGEKEVGYIGSVARHYELGPIALAVIKRNLPLEEQLTAAGIPAAQEQIFN